MTLLARIIPHARFIHMIRDGRNVAASVVKRPWGPNDLATAMDWWTDQTIAIGRAEAHAPANRLLRLRLESLVGPGREVWYERLRGFLGIDDDAGMRRFFRESVTGPMATRGRWRKNRDDDEITEIEKRYELALAGLEEAGVSLPDVD